MPDIAEKELTHPETGEIRIEAVLQALADPVRLRIVAALARLDEAVPCGSVDVGVSKSTVTHHMRILREAGVTRVRCEGTTRLTALRRTDLDVRFPGLLDGVLSGLDR